MKVILNSDVANLGEEGDILEVSNGYARNYLLPQGLVLEYNKRNLAKIEERREVIEKRKTTKRTEAMSVKERLESEDLTIAMTAGRNGKLFGSVTSATIAEHLSARGIDVERKKIEVPDKSIKATGNYKVRIRLYGGAEAVLTVRVDADGKASAAPEETEQLEEPAVEETPAEEAVAEEEADTEEAIAEEEAASEEDVADDVAVEEEAATEEEAAEEEAAPADEADAEDEDK